VAPDLPGQGLSDPIDFPRNRYRQTAIAWLDGLFDALELEAAALLGHSGGGVGAVVRAVSPGPGEAARADRSGRADRRDGRGLRAVTRSI
jgi:hypothetical protein